ncbi:hypothetical protein [Arcanobacterium canis]
MIEKMKGWGKKQWAIFAVVALVVVGGIGSFVDPPKPVKPVATTKPSATPKQATTPKTSAKPAKPTQARDGMNYTFAAAKCDNHLKLKLAGRDYNSDSIMAKRFEGVGENPDEYVAVYGAKIDGARVIVNCVVAGTPESPRLVSVKVLER